MGIQSTNAVQAWGGLNPDPILASQDDDGNDDDDDDDDVPQSY